MIGLDSNILVAYEITDHPDHLRTRGTLESLFLSGADIALCSTVLTEFVHIVTDTKRFVTPSSMREAIESSEVWWESPFILQVYPSQESVDLFHE
jgi:predicted nucleic acid-binding protein